MTKKINTKRSLLMSALALLMCFSMLIGSTYAWFTDSVTSGNNKIVSGNLDVELFWSTDAANWTEVNEDTNVFKENTLWEPGHTEVVYLKVRNAGTLALKYNLGINVSSETLGINVDDDPFKLSDYILYNIYDGVKNYANSAEARGTEIGTKLNTPYSQASQLLKTGDETVVTMVVFMPTTVGNEANYKTGTNAPVINLGINLFATQYTHEKDSFNEFYDKDAAWTGSVDTTWYKDGESTFTLDTAEKLAGLAQLVNAGNSFEGKTIELNADMDLNNINWTPIGTKAATFMGTFNGNGHTISNLKSIGTKSVGLFGATWVGAHIENVKVVNAYVSGEDYVGVILGGGYLAKNCIKDCVVENATVIATPYFDSNKGVYDGGAKAGGIVGQAYNGSILGCTVKNANITAYRDLGGIAGMLSADGTTYDIYASNNTVEKVTLSYIGVAGKYDDGKTPNQFMGDIVGRVGNKTVVSDDNKGEATKNEANKGAIMIFTLNELIDFANKVNAGDKYQGKTVILGADIDLANMDWTPIGKSGTSFNGTFDGNGHTISNLKINLPTSRNVGFFGTTSNGEIKNLTIKNAQVTGDLEVGVVAGTPYTSKFTNVKVTGHVEVFGDAYVGGVGGKSAYANWTDVTVDVDDTSYVKAISTENGIAYRTYVGGVVGFNGEGNHTFKNITSNIDVIGDVCDIGGVFGIAHYGNNFENITCTGNVTNLVSSDNDGADATTDVLETGLIAGVWHNENGTKVTFANISATGTISTPNVVPAKEFANNGLIGKAYSASGTGELIIVNYSEVDGMTLATYPITGEVVLCKISNDAPEMLNIPEGVTALGSKILNGNTTVKEVVIPSTVISFGGTPNADGTGASGGMFYKSAVEKVVLPEGLKEIPVAAFNQATKLKEVNIPSSVTSIGINAFAGSALTNLTIPATVETIGYGAFRDMLSLTTATIEGDVYVPSYAFRNCAGLKSVYLNGTNVSFGDNMIFTVTSTNNENPNGITVYVKNDGIKARLEATKQFKGTIVSAASADENGIYTDSNGNKFAYAVNDTELTTAIENDAKTVILGSGNYIIPDSAQGKTLTIVGNGETVVAAQDDGAAEGDCDYSFDGSTVTFENVTITTSTTYFPGYARMKGIYNNCTINGVWTLYDNSEFNNCTFNVNGDLYNVWTWGAATATFNNCTFNNDGKAILLYGQANTKLTVKGCTFNDNGDDTVTGKAAIEIGNDYNKSYELIVNDTVVSGYAINTNGINTNTTLWANKNSMGTDKLNVVVDGVDVY